MAKAAARPDSNKTTFATYEMAGPTLLAQQSSKPDERPDTRIKPYWNVLRGHLESRLIGLRNWRQSWWTQNWSDLAQYILPRRSIWLTQSSGGIPSPNNMSRGREINTAIVDPTATFAMRVCAGGLMSGLASPSRPWFKIMPSSKGFQLDAEASQWMDEVEDIIYTILARSNFYNSFAQACEDIVVFGTAVTIIYEDEKEMIRCYNPAIGEFYLSSDATMRVDGQYRAFVMTIAQIVGFFTLEKCPADVQKLWQAGGSSLDQERIIAHSIEPNFEVQGNADTKVKGNFTWREVYWVYGSGSTEPLSMRGFNDKPFTAARWSTQSNDAYGRSPGMDVLPDVIQLQVETRRKAEAIEKNVRPPMLADIAMKNQPSSALPGHVTYVPNLGAGTGMRSMYEVNLDIKDISADIMMVQQRIKTGFFNDLFLMISQTGTDRMTATEIASRAQEKLAVLGPVIEGLLSEDLQPKLARVFAVLKRRGMLPALPKSLVGVPLEVQFVSILAQAAKAAATGGIERIVALIGNMAAVYPEVKDVGDPIEIVREMNALLGNPNKILRGPEAVKQIAQQREQDQKRQQMMAEMQHGAQTANIGADAASTMSQTQIGGGQQALSAILGTSGGGQGASV